MPSSAKSHDDPDVVRAPALHAQPPSSDMGSPFVDASLPASGTGRTTHVCVVESHCFAPLH